MTDDWGGSDGYWGSPQDNQQEPQSQTQQGIPGMSPMAPQQAPFSMQAGGAFPQNQGFPQANPQPAQQGDFSQANPQLVQQGDFSQANPQLVQQGDFPQANQQPAQQGNTSTPQQEKPKTDTKPFIMIAVILVVIAVVTIGVYFFQRGIKEKNTASITTSQQAHANSNKRQSESSKNPHSQGITSDPSEKENNTQEKSPDTSWDSTKDDSGKATDARGLSEVGSLPDVASRGSSGAIVASKHVYALDKGYVYSLELSLSTGNSNSVEFFVSKDNFDKINTGTIVSVEYVKYSDGRVGISSINSNSNSSEN